MKRAFAAPGSDMLMRSSTSSDTLSLNTHLLSHTSSSICDSHALRNPVENFWGCVLLLKLWGGDTIISIYYPIISPPTLTHPSYSTGSYGQRTPSSRGPAYKTILTLSPSPTSSWPQYKLSVSLQEDVRREWWVGVRVRCQTICSEGQTF